MDLEGRIITLEFDEFFVTQVYTPNAGDGLKTLGRTSSLGCQICRVLGSTRQAKTCPRQPETTTLPTRKLTLPTQPATDVHQDLQTKNDEGFTNLLAKGFTDTFRHIHGDVPERYTWWAQRSKTSKINNTGWRIDYWLTSNRVADKVTKSDMIDSAHAKTITPSCIRD